MQLTVVEALFDFGDRPDGVLRIGEIDLDVVLGAGLPRALLGKRMARAGDHPPAGAGKALDRGVTDAAAGAGQEQRAARLVSLRARHVRSNSRGMQMMIATSRI